MKLLCNQCGQKPVLARGLCQNCYSAAWKTGAHLSHDKLVDDHEAYYDKARRRFMALVEVQDDGCWKWLGAFGGNNDYGVFYLHPKYTSANHASFLLFKGPLADGHQACHTCDHPYCVNPEHLFDGTQIENEADKVAKGRSEQGSKRYNAKLTEADVLSIRAQKGMKTHTQLAAEFGVARPGISRILSGHIWQHVVGGCH